MNRRFQRDPKAIAFARHQRATANEFAQDVWQMLRNRRCRHQKFRREYPIPPYTVDFCCVALNLMVEVDGEHHQTDEGRQYDQRRDQFLAERGYQVVRIAERTPSSPALLPRDEGENDSPSSRGRREPD